MENKQGYLKFLRTKRKKEIIRQLDGEVNNLQNMNFTSRYLFL